MKKFVHRPRAGAVDTGPVVVRVSGGLPQDDAEDVQPVVRKFVADGRRVKVVGGLPDELAGELMSAEDRKAHDSATYAAVMGSAGTLGTGLASKED